MSRPRQGNAGSSAAGRSSRREAWRRRSVSISAVTAFTVLITVTVPLWLPVVVVLDVVMLRRRLPLARLLAFGVCWGWIELGGVARAFGTWAVGRGHDPATQYRLMKWWAGALMRALQATIGISPRLEGGEALEGGNVIVLSRHASLADSLLSALAIRVQADLWPRYVLKRELLHDPCLDIVGLRIPNHFLDRQAADSQAELDALRELASGVGPGSAAVIFTEGTRSNPRKRARALDKIAERDPERAMRLGALLHLLPPRPAGSAALVEGAPAADVVLAWHTGFDGLDSFGGIVAKLARPLPPVRFVVRRVPRDDVPTGDDFVRWLDDQWLRMDAEVAGALGSTGPGSTGPASTELGSTELGLTKGTS
jgi:1-acyl-sn-glycerol-3-phosphate acyltransferase